MIKPLYLIKPISALCVFLVVHGFFHKSFPFSFFFLLVLCVHEGVSTPSSVFALVFLFLAAYIWSPIQFTSCFMLKVSFSSGFLVLLASFVLPPPFIVSNLVQLYPITCLCLVCILSVFIPSVFGIFILFLRHSLIQ